MTHMPLIVLDPLVEDQIAEACARTFRQTEASIKALAAAAGKKRRTAARWALEGKGHPLFEVSVVVYRLGQTFGAHAYVFASHVTAMAFQGEVSQLNHNQLIQRYWLTNAAVSETLGELDRARALFALTGDLGNVADVALPAASRLEEFGAIARELERLRLDPRAMKEPRRRA